MITYIFFNKNNMYLGKLLSKYINNYQQINNKINIINKGTNAGGCNTNINGLSYEILTNLETEFEVITNNKYFKNITFKNNNKNKFIYTKQSNLFKCMDKFINKNIVKGHGCKNPDECFINQRKKIIFIIEKKFQQVNGSVCEKIQTPDFKLWQYNRTFPDYKIVYIYCLSEWFKKNCKAELEYLEYKDIPVFWGNSNIYKTNIIKYMINYK